MSANNIHVIGITPLLAKNKRECGRKNILRNNGQNFFIFGEKQFRDLKIR